LVKETPVKDIALDIAKRRTVQNGEVIFLEGQPGDKAYVILRGHADVVVTTDFGKETALTRMGPGELFGELAILTPANKRTATVVAAEACELLEIDREIFDSRLGASDPLLRFVLEHLTRRLLELTSKVVHDDI
jgi:CRP-like cAMP-binding protein